MQEQQLAAGHRDIEHTMLQPATNPQFPELGPTDGTRMGHVEPDPEPLEQPQLLSGSRGVHRSKRVEELLDGSATTGSLVEQQLPTVHDPMIARTLYLVNRGRAEQLRSTARFSAPYGRVVTGRGAPSVNPVYPAAAISSHLAR